MNEDLTYFAIQLHLLRQYDTEKRESVRLGPSVIAREFGIPENKAMTYLNELLSTDMFQGILQKTENEFIYKPPNPMIHKMILEETEKAYSALERALIETKPTGEMEEVVVATK